MNRCYRAVILRSDFQRGFSGMTFPASYELFHTRRFNLHWLSRSACEFGSDDGESGFVLATKTGTQCCADNTHRISLNAKRRGKAHPVCMDSPRGLPDCQPFAFPHGNCRSGFQRRGGVRRSAERHAEYAVRLLEPFIGIPAHQRQRLSADQVAAGMHLGRARLHSVPCAHNKRQHLIFQFDQACCVLRKFFVIRRYRRYLVADIAHFAVKYRQVGCQPALRSVKGCQNRANAPNTFYRGYVDRDDAGMGMRAADNLAVQHPRQLNVAGVLCLASQFLRQVPS